MREKMFIWKHFKKKITPLLVIALLTNILVGCQYFKNSIENDSKTYSHRKGILKVEIPEEYLDCSVNIEQLEHSFIFGGTVNHMIFQSYENYNKYKNILNDADGIFNTFVDEGSFKWTWNSQPDGSVGLEVNKLITEWVLENNNSIRHHTLFWSNEKHIPDWVKDLDNNALKEAIYNRIDYVSKEVGESIVSLDVINEMLIYRYFRDRLGDEIIGEIYKETARQIPSAKLYINENPLHLVNNEDDLSQIITIDAFKAYIIEGFLDFLDEMDSLNVNYEGIGLQAHFVDLNEYNDRAKYRFDFDNSDYIELYEELITSIYEKTGKKVFISEFDFKTTDNAERTEFVIDFYEAMFENEHIEGILFWTWYYHDDGTPELINPATGALNNTGKQLYKLITQIWHTNYKKTVVTNGYIEVEAYFGKYEISYIRDGIVIGEQVTNFN